MLPGRRLGTRGREATTTQTDSQSAPDSISSSAASSSTFAAFGYRDYSLFWVGNSISNIGTWMQTFGLGVLVVQIAAQEGHPELASLYLGIIGLARAVPGLLLGLIGGVVADRSDYRKLLIITQTVAGLDAAVLAALVYTQHISVWWVAALSGIASVAFAFDGPTRLLMITGAVPTRSLPSAIGLNSASFNGATLVGPLIGGLLIIPFGVAGLLVANALSFLAVDLALLFVRPRRMEEMAVGRSQSMLQSLREGISFIVHDPEVRTLQILGLSAALFGRQIVQLLPAIATNMVHTDEQGLAWLLAASGMGAFLGAFGTAWLGNVRQRGLVLILSLGSLGAFHIILATQHELWIALLLMVPLGFTHVLFIGLQSTLTQLSTPGHLRGRVMSVQTMSFQGALPLGTLVLGSMGTFVGLPVTLFIGGLIVLLLAATALVLRQQFRP